mmetsp:Transcript_35815/g.111444  ORF Transcript_35815/g.111444 Transcript_35815/m.111444 type:complete len:571 (-) Transcript_35815:179-1891(-)
MALPLVLKQGAPSLPVPTYCGATKDLVVSSLQSASDEVVLGTLKQVGLLGPSGAAALGYVADVLKVAEIEASSEVRCAALAAVGEMGEPAVSEIDRVLALFEDDDPSVVCAAISAVGAMGPAAVDSALEIVGFLQDEAPEFRAAAAGALGTMKAWMYADELKPCLDDPDVGVVLAAVAAIGAMGEDGQQLAGDVAARLGHVSRGVRLAAVKALTRIGDAGERHAESVAGLLADEDNLIREATVGYFEAAGTGAKKGAEAVAKLLSSTSGRVQAASALALGHMKMDKFAQDVAKLLGSEYKEDTSLALSAAGVEPKLPAVLRRPACAAATALSMMGDEGAAYSSEVGALLTEDTVPEAAGPLIRALGLMGAVSCEAKICGLLEETAAPVREAACFALGELAKVAEDADSVAALAARLKDSNMLVRQAAAVAVGNCKTHGPKYAGELAKLFGDRACSVKAAAARAMGSLGQVGQMYATAVARLTFEAAADNPTRVVALEVLGDMGERGSAFAEDVAALLEDPDGPVRAAALKALSKMGNDAVPFLPQVTKACVDPLDSVRAAADECTAALGG